MTISASARLKELLVKSHVAYSRAEIVVSGVPYDIPVLSGSVSVDARRSMRRTLSMETIDVDGTLTSGGFNAILAPFGQELTVFRGVLDPATGTRSSDLEVPLGVFRILSTDISVGEDGAISVSISAEDRVSAISRQRFSGVLEIPEGVRYMGETDSPSGTSAGAVQRILDALKGATTFPRNLPTVGNTINYRWVGSDPDEDPWIAISQLAQGVGYEIYFDTLGVLQATVVPTLSASTITWEYLQDDSNVVLSMQRTLSAEDIRNGVQITPVDGSSGAGYGEAYDTNPLSPTRVDVLGRRPVKIDNPYVRTTTQAQTAATRLLPAYIGQPVSWTQIPNPAMDVRDIVRIQETRLGLDMLILVDSINLPLDANSTMSVQGRSLQ